MDNPGARLGYLIDMLKHTNATFGKIIGVKGGAVGEMVGGARPIGGIILKKIAEKFPDLSLNWLLVGIGDMYLPKTGIVDTPNYENDSVPKNVNEPISSYDIAEPFEAMLLNYMDRPRIKEKIKEILKGK